MALDGLRGIAILLVLLAHAHVAASGDWPSLLTVVVQTGGWVGVDLFFVLSGFLITGILVRNRGSYGYFRTFYARRALRIWPLYYLTIALAFLVAPHIWLLDVVSMQGHASTWIFFLQNVYMAVQLPHVAAFDNLWSVAVEEQFYLVLPILVLRCSPKYLPLVLLGGVLVGLATRIILYAAGASPIVTYVLMPARIDSLAIGGLLSIGLANATWRAALARMAMPLVGLTALVLLCIGVADFGFDPYQPMMRTWGYTVLAVFFGAILVMAVTSSRVGGLLSAPWLRLFGKYSYAIYLLHYPLWGLIEPSLWQPIVLGSHLPAQLVAWVVMATISLTIGWLCWTLIERHTLSLKRYFPEGAVHHEVHHQQMPNLNRVPHPPRAISR